MIEERGVHLDVRRPRFHLNTRFNCGRVPFATEHSFLPSSLSGRTAFQSTRLLATAITPQRVGEGCMQAGVFPSESRVVKTVRKQMASLDPLNNVRFALDENC